MPDSGQVPARPSSSLTVIIPALNEVESIPNTLGELVPVCREHGWKIIVVDDGSDDGTGDVVRSRYPDDVRVVRHKIRRGYGAAVKSGIAAAETDFVATFDADGQHDPADLPRLLAVAEELDADMVIGDRGSHASNPYRELGKWIIKRIARVLLPVEIRDLNTGLRLLRTDLGRRYSAFLPSSPAFCDVVTLAFISDRRVVHELSCSVRERTAGTSKMSTMTALETVIEIVNIITLFNPVRIFVPLAVLAVLTGTIWGIPYVVMGRGISVGAMLAIVTGVILFALGLLAEQLAAIRKTQSLSGGSPVA